jgi:hypothetical protein
MAATQFAEPNTRVTMTLDELSKMQAVAGIHLTFSLTLACPLTCAHCIVDAGPDKGKTTMPLEVARHYASQMPELYEHGIRIIGLTGGEPFLAREQLRILSNASSAVGMKTGVVTAAHWATSEEAARKVVESFPGIDIWDMSVDSFHEEFIGVDRVKTAYQAVKGNGRRPVVRFTYQDPPTPVDRRLLDFIHTFAEEKDIFSQTVRSVGRASELPIFPAGGRTNFAKPCWTKGLVIRYDGSMAPCCISLVEERKHPFQLGDARSRPLAEIHDEYMSHPLLQLIRSIGFGEVMDWLREAGIDDPSLNLAGEDVCDLCPRIMTNPGWAQYLADRAAKPANRLRIAVLTSRVFGEQTMLQRTVRELEGDADRIEGFALAAALAAENGA